MTTIAIKDGVMACDSLVTLGHTKSMLQYEKIMLHEDVYYGFAGACHSIDVVRLYITGEIEIGDIPESYNVTYLSMPKTGKAQQHHINKSCRTSFILPPYYALGSGSEFALVAMSCGKSAVEAVKEAIKWDCISGGKVKSYSFNKPRATKKPKKEVGVFDDWEEVRDE